MRQILGIQNEVNSCNLSTGNSPRLLTGSNIEKVLRTRRSASYMRALGSLDVGGHVTDPNRLADVLATVQSEFPEVCPQDQPLGILARCRLGEPYELHTFDFAMSQILCHYERSQSLPTAFESARSLAMHPAYEFVEVYDRSLRGVMTDGSVSVVKI